MNQSEFEIKVRKYIGIPYVHGGRDLNGVDCLGLAYLIYKEYGICIPDTDGCFYEKDWFRTDPGRYLRGIQKYGRPVEFSQLQALDFVYFRMGGVVTHGGVMIDTGRFIHVLERTRSHVSYLNYKWHRRLVGARRFI